MFVTWYSLTQHSRRHKKNDEQLSSECEYFNTIIC